MIANVDKNYTNLIIMDTMEVVMIKVVIIFLKNLKNQKKKLN